MLLKSVAVALAGAVLVLLGVAPPAEARSRHEWHGGYARHGHLFRHRHHPRVYHSYRPVYRYRPVYYAAPVYRPPVVYGGTYAIGYSGGDCHWLKRRALATGNPFHWEQYRHCKWRYGY